MPPAVSAAPSNGFLDTGGRVNYVITEYNEDDGLPTGEANTILQSSDGYIWIGSYGGLIRYDGTSFVNYGSRLESASVRCLFEDSQGRLFIGTNDAGAYCLENDEFIRAAAHDSRTFKCVRDFTETPDGKIYAASVSGVAEVSGDTLVPLSFNSSAEQFKSIASDSRGYVVAVTSVGKLFVFKDGKCLGDVDSQGTLSEGYATAVLADGELFYIGTSNGEVVQTSLSADGGVSFTQISKQSTGVEAIDHMKLRNNRLLVSGLAGFGYFDSFNKFVRVDKDESSNLSANWAETDYENNFWVASSAYGVIRYSPGCFDNFNEAAGLDGVMLNAVQIAGGYFFAGTDFGVSMFDSGWNRVDNELTRLLEGIRIRNITTDKAGRVWIATYSDMGAVRYDTETGEIEYFGTAKGLQSSKVRVVYGLSDGRMLIGNQFGISIAEGDSITEQYGMADGMVTTSVLCAAEADGKIIVGTDGSGIYELTYEPGAAKARLTEHSADEGLTDGVILRIVPDSDTAGNYFVCGGDNFYYYENGTFRRLNNFDKGSGGLYNAIDRDGKIWMMQDDGVRMTDKAELLSGEHAYTAKYGVECGLSGTLFANTWSYCDEEEGILCLPTRSGFSIFRFRGVDIGIPYGIVNSVTIDDKRFEHPDSVDLESGAQRVTMDISALLFSDTAKYQIGYQLVGFDAEEIVTDDRHVSVSYTNLPGGDYTFAMRVIDPLTGLSSHTLEVGVQKEKKLTEQTWFAVLMLAATVRATILIVRGIFALRRKRIRERQKELQDITEQALLTVARTIDAKDRYTRGHSSRVAVYSREIARRMGFSEEEQQNIYFIALLHDIGKIGVPDNVLNKNGPLDPEERKIIQQHPVTGGNILNDFRALEGIADGARYHHEKYDGTGYGEGLAGEDIPLVARIIGIADSYDAMQSTRVYRPSLTDEKIISELKNGAGKQFDPNIVPIMLSMIEDGTAPVEVQ